MDIHDRKGLKAAAKEALLTAYHDPKKLILIHTGASVALSLLLVLVNYFLEQQISGTGGLGGVGIRAILETVQTVLILGQTVALVFWQIGYSYVSLGISRGEDVGPGSLLEGFRRFGPVLRQRLIVTLLCSGLVFACVYGASIIVSMTPLTEPLLQAMEVGTEEALMAAMEEAMLPVIGISIVLMLAVVVPYYYRLRMADYALMDNFHPGAMASIRASRALMKGNRMTLFKLDLSFWWFYVLESLTMVVSYGDLILPMFGVSLPWSETFSSILFVALAYLCQLALYWWQGNEVHTTYANFYNALLPKEEGPRSATHP